MASNRWYKFLCLLCDVDPLGAPCLCRQIKRNKAVWCLHGWVDAQFCNKRDPALPLCWCLNLGNGDCCLFIRNRYKHGDVLQFESEKVSWQKKKLHVPYIHFLYEFCGELFQDRRLFTFRRGKRPKSWLIERIQLTNSTDHPRDRLFRRVNQSFFSSLLEYFVFIEFDQGSRWDWFLKL